MGLLTRVYTHMDLQIRFAGHRLPADLAGDQVLASVDLEVHLQRAFPVALEVAHVAFMLLPLAVRLHVRAEVGGTGVRCFADPADEWLLAGVREEMSFQSLIRVEPLAADLAVDHVLFVVLLLVQAQVVAGHLGYATDIASEAFVVLLQVSLEELLSLEALGAQNALERPFLLVHLHHVLLQLLVVDEVYVALLATTADLFDVPLVVLPVLQKLQLLAYPLVANITLVDHCTLLVRVAFIVKVFVNVVDLLRLQVQFHF